MDPDPALDKASAYPNEPAPMSKGAPPASGAGGAAQEYRLRVLMEPRGFLRAIEFDKTFASHVNGIDNDFIGKAMVNNGSAFYILSYAPSVEKENTSL